MGKIFSIENVLLDDEYKYLLTKYSWSFKETVSIAIKGLQENLNSLDKFELGLIDEETCIKEIDSTNERVEAEMEDPKYDSLNKL